MADSPPAPIRFEFTEAEAQIAASRATLRQALGGGLLQRHVAPLAAFALLMAFVAILAFTGLIARRPAEIVILLAAAAYMVHRLASRRRFARVRRECAAAMSAWRAAGMLTLSFEPAGAALTGAGDARWEWRFAPDCEAEDAGGMIYLWPARGAPLCAPSRAFADAAAVVAFMRARCRGRS